MSDYRSEASSRSAVKTELTSAHLEYSLSLASTMTDSHQGSANIWFGSAYVEGSSILGIAIVKPSSTIVNVDLPIGEIDAWLDILKGNRQAYFAYILQGDTAADGATDVISVALTTEHDPDIYNFITDAVMSGLPPHIAQVIAGHNDINTTMNYKAFTLKRPSSPTWPSLPGGGRSGPPMNTGFRAMRNGGNSSGTSSARKSRPGYADAHSELFAFMSKGRQVLLHWPDPAQRDRLEEIRDNLHDRIAEAERESWLGEVEGLKVSLADAEDKLAQIDRRTTGDGPVGLGATIPSARSRKPAPAMTTDELTAALHACAAASTRSKQASRC